MKKVLLAISVLFLTITGYSQTYTISDSLSVNFCKTSEVSFVSGVQTDSIKWILNGGGKPFLIGDTLHKAEQLISTTGMFYTTDKNDTTYAFDSIKAILYSGASSDTVVFHFTVYESPVALFSNDNDLNDSVITLTNYSTGQNLIYLWSFGDSSTSTDILPEHSYTTAGPYKIDLTVTDTIALCSSSYTDSSVYKTENLFRYLKVESPQTTGIKNVSEDKVSVYPNPSSGNVTIDGAKGAMKIFNELSQQVFEKENISEKETINLSTGVYFVKFENTGETKKLVIK